MFIEARKNQAESDLGGAPQGRVARTNATGDDDLGDEEDRDDLLYVTFSCIALPSKLLPIGSCPWFSYPILPCSDHVLAT